MDNNNMSPLTRMLQRAISITMALCAIAITIAVTVKIVMWAIQKGGKLNKHASESKKSPAGRRADAEAGGGVFKN